MKIVRDTSQYKQPAMDSTLVTKRLYLPYSLEWECPKCGYKQKHELTTDGCLPRYPSLDGDVTCRLRCQDCEHELEVEIELKLTITPKLKG